MTYVHGVTDHEYYIAPELESYSQELLLGQASFTSTIDGEFCPDRFRYGYLLFYSDESETTPFDLSDIPEGGSAMEFNGQNVCSTDQWEYQFN